MVKFINSWAQGIILAVIIATIIEIIVPEGNNKKYVKTIIGIYILFSIIYPLLTKISNKSININSIITSANREILKYESDTNITLETNSYIEQTYKAKIEEDIKNEVSQKGYKVILLNTSIEAHNEEKYGQIKEILIKIEKIEKKEKEEINNTTSNRINQINKIEINLNNSIEDGERKEKEEITGEEIKSLKEYLNTTYGTPIDKIYINK